MRSPRAQKVPIRQASCAGLAALGAALLVLAPPAPATSSEPSRAAADRRAEQLLVVDCLLPGQVRTLGTRTTYLSARRPARLPARDCQIRGGEYVTYDRADWRSALAAWLPAAESGDAEAQLIAGEIYERGLGVAPNYAAALRWYRAAAEAGSRKAQVNLGFLVERGLGTEADPTAAAAWYRRAAGSAADIEIDSGPPDDGGREATERRAQQVEAAAARLQSELDGARRALASATGELAMVRTEAAAARAALEGAEAAAREIATAREAAQAESARVDELRSALAARDAELADRRAEAERLAQKVAELQSQAAAAATRDIVSVARAAGDLPDDRAPPVDVKFGAYHALIIGNNDYRQLPDLASPANDATALARLLDQRYGFRTTVLLDADRYQILSALNRLREALTSDDNLLVYFAGHGELDEVNQRGHWLPVDAERDSTANWIPNTAVTDLLNIMQARHVMLVVDSCYAGTLTRSSIGRLDAGMTADERLHWLRAMAERRARTVLTSGGIAPVLDAGGGRHSVFAKALLEVLEVNEDVMDGARLHREVAARVAYAAAGLQFEQVPEYAPIRFSGHEGGEFLLAPRR